LMLS